MLKSRDIQALKFHCCRQFISSYYFMKGFISMDINLELYKVFYYVATTLSFSEASRQLFISQSAVSQSIKTLEKKLNHPLFIRSTKKVLLTPEGELLLQHVKPALQLLDEGESLPVSYTHLITKNTFRIFFLIFYPFFFTFYNFYFTLNNFPLPISGTNNT